MENVAGWNELLINLETRAKAREGEDKRGLKGLVLQAIYDAEAASAPQDITERLDQLLLYLTEATRENVCTNTKCPHYNKKCKMR